MNENTTDVQSVDLKQGNGALWTIAGTAIAMAAKQVLGGPGGVGGLFGPPGPPPVSREVADLMVENALLKANAHADKMNADQMVVNAVQQGKIECLEKEVARLYGLTQLTVPNGNLNPGYGAVEVVPVPGPVTSTANVTAIVQAVLAAQKATSGTTTANG